MINKYCIEILSDRPPLLHIGDMIAGGQVVAIRDDSPPMVSVRWLVERYGLSSNTISAKLCDIAQGTSGKRLYPRLQAMAILDSDTKQRAGRKRKN